MIRKPLPRSQVRDLYDSFGSFTPIEVCMQRDPKGLYEKAKAGKIKNFTGIDSPYEAPQRADFTIKTVEASPEDHAQAIVKHLREKGYLG